MSEIRRQRLLLLLEQAKERDGLSQTAFAKKYDLDPAYLSHMVTGKRNVGPSIVKKLEKGVPLEPGFMDKPLPNDEKDVLAEEARSMLLHMSEEGALASLEFMRNTLKNERLLQNQSFHSQE